jgi:sulfur carrier protein ThiS
MPATDTQAVATRQVTVVSGANTQNIDLPEGEEVTVANLLARYGEFLNVRRADNNILVNNEPVNAERVVRPGDRVEFVRPAGQKAS